MNPLARRLRRLVVIAMLLGIGAAIAGMFPGERHWADSNDCFGYGLSTLISTEHPHHESCEPKFDKLVGETRSGGLPLITYIGLVLACAAFVYRRPTRANAFGWSTLTIFAGAAWVMDTFSLGNMFEHVEVLPAAHIMSVLFGAMLLVAIPIAFIVALIGDHWAPDESPRARIVT